MRTRTVFGWVYHELDEGEDWPDAVEQPNRSFGHGEGWIHCTICSEAR